ncbi:TlpA disulfide reductase family protein [Pedobacter sp. MC2016-24]|uniref:TlpA disulfide reductase family protein n=1 Tax=Pedobacter sp. MC2016-24 TaxID=2780090 RepID=UPI00188310AD|nr:TlpA disulfide reductase family protein [Pedobacter sp. MC2016-24]MBE9599262.1 AhpC/TSA family protein [Pedobacter sp. MC2016-24]
MKSINICSIALVLAPLFGAAQAGNSFTLTGKVSDYQRAVDNTVYLQFKQNGKEIKDSAKLINGTYSFKGIISYPVNAILQLKVADSVAQYHKQTRILKDYACEFYLDQGKLLANAPQKLNSTVIQGSAADTDRQQLKAILDPYYDASNKLYSKEGTPAYKSKDSIAIAKYTKKSYALQDKIDSAKKAFLFSHPQSGMVLDMLSEYTRTILEPAEIEPFFNKIQPALKASAEGQAYASRIEKSKVTALGAQAENFVLKDRNGKNVSLASLKGKLVLLDFWGSWCFPCRSTHPHLRKLYAEYKDKGFEILGVASERGKPDENYKKWTAALDQDQMTWVNVLSEQAEKGQQTVPGKYNVNAYPTKVLIDQNGIIVKKFVGSGAANAEALDKLVEQLLSKN